MSNNSHCWVFAALAACALLAACADVPDSYTDRRDAVSLAAGEAVAANRVTQMIDPWSRASANRNIAFNGQRAQAAMERYRTNKVIEPVSAVTSSASYQASQQGSVAATAGTKQ